MLSVKCNFSCTGTLSKLFSLPPKPCRPLVCSILSLNPALVACLFFCSSFPVGHLLHHQVAGQLFKQNSETKVPWYNSGTNAGKALLEILGGVFGAVRRPYPPCACIRAVSLPVRRGARAGRGGSPGHAPASSSHSPVLYYQ